VTGISRIGDGVSAPGPLAPTKLTDLAPKVQDRWQRGVETEVDRVRRELVLEPLEAQHVEPGEDRDHHRLTTVRTRVRP
jgi:hypothetical protein